MGERRAESQGQTSLAVPGHLRLTPSQEGSPALLLVPMDRHTGTILALDTALGRWHLIQLPDTSNRHQRSILGALRYKQMVWHPPLETNGECWMPQNSLKRGLSEVIQYPPPVDLRQF